jgi:hypothetical protein
MIGLGLSTTGARGILAPNLLLAPNAFDNAAWLKASGGTGSASVVTANDGTAPDGTETADLLAMDLNGGTTLADQSWLIQIREGVLTAGRSYRGGAWLRTRTGTATLIYRHAGGGSYGGLPVTTTWTRFERTEVAAGADLYFELGLRGSFGASDAAEVEIWGAFLERV